MEEGKIPPTNVSSSPAALQTPQDGTSEPQRITRRWPRWMKLNQPAIVILILAVAPIVLLVATNSNFLTQSSLDLLFDQTLPCDMNAAWTSWEGLFQINARTGAMSFAAAKGIDIVWDFVMGQGLRAGLAVTAWRVYGEAIIRIMEENAIPYELFTSVALSNTLDTCQGIYETLRRIKSSRAKWTVVWMLLSMSYLTVFPTLLSASTSYVAVSQRAVRLIDNSTTPLEEYVNNTASFSYDFHNGSAPWIVNLQYYEGGESASCDLISLITHSYGGHGIKGLYDGAIQVNGTLYNVSSATVTCGFEYDGHFYLADNNTQRDTGSYDPLGFVPQQQIVCQPTSRYQWGFSFQILLLVVIIHAVWSLALYVVWLDGQKHSSLVKSGHRLGRWKAIMELGVPLRKEIGATTTSYSESELSHKIRRLRPIKYVMRDDDHGLIPEGDTIHPQPC